MLVEWNERFNLNAESTLPHIWSRHFADCAQLMPFIPDEARVLADIGAGAGFPSLVLAILAADRPYPLEIHAIESIGKKADFLQAVVDRLALPVKVRRSRAEDIKDLKADIVTARAVKALPELLGYASHVLKKDGLCLFLKGRQLKDEIEAAKKIWAFDYATHPSKTDDEAGILILSNLVYKSWRKR
jgi:16S rRNA (guanine527-N7)-methyltransferase